MYDFMHGLFFGGLQGRALDLEFWGLLSLKLLPPRTGAFKKSQKSCHGNAPMVSNKY